MTKTLEALIAEAEQAKAIAVKAEQAVEDARKTIEEQQQAEAAAKAAEEEERREAEVEALNKKNREIEEQLKDEAINGSPIPVSPNNDLSLSVEQAYEVVTARTQIRMDLIYDWSTIGFISVMVYRAKITAMNRILREERQKWKQILESAQRSADINAAVEAAAKVQGLDGISDFPLPEIPADELQKTMANAYSALIAVRVEIQNAIPEPMINQYLMANHPHAIAKACQEEKLALKSWRSFHDRFQNWMNRMSDWMHRSPIFDYLSYLVEGHNLAGEKDGFIAEAKNLADLIEVANSKYRDPFRA